MECENPIFKAARFARKAHAGQTRKFSGEPYAIHPARVAGMVAVEESASVEMVIAAFLHDVLEDTDVPESELEREFGRPVVLLVRELTNPSKTHPGPKLPREQRKAMDHDHLAKVSNPAKLIKYYDRIDNLRDYLRADTDFLKRYIHESRQLVEALGSPHPHLKERLLRLCDDLAKKHQPDL